MIRTANADGDKRRGRAATGPGQLLSIQLEATQLAALDLWIDGHGRPKPDRAEAIRKLIDRGLQAEAAQNARDVQRLGGVRDANAARARAATARSDARQIDRLENEGGSTRASISDRRRSSSDRAEAAAGAAVDVALKDSKATDEVKAQRKRTLLARPATGRIARRK